MQTCTCIITPINLQISQVGDSHEFYSALLVLIIISIIMQVILLPQDSLLHLLTIQVLLGILFLIQGGLDINHQDHQKTAVILNNTTTVFLFIITVINVIISGFGIQHTGTVVPGSKLS
jgi:hypothetical protein